MLVGLPPVGDPLVTAVSEDSEVIALTTPILPAAAAVPAVDELAPAVVRHANPEAYGHQGWQPAPLAEMAGSGWVRGQRIGRLIVRPFQYDAVRGQLRVHRRLRITLGYPPGVLASANMAEAVAAAGVADPFGTLLDRTLVNGAQARGWRLARGPQPADTAALALAPSEAGPVWNIHVASTGMQRLTGAELAAAGLPVGQTDPRRLALYLNGAPVALAVTGEADGRLDPDDAVVFAGRAEPTRYAGDSVYQLTVASVPGLRMAEQAAAPAGLATAAASTDTVRAEQDLIYRSDFPRLPLGRPAPAGVDHWLWRQLGAPESIDVSVPLPAVAPGNWTGWLRVAVVGKSSLAEAVPDHTLRALVNDTPVGTGRWDGNTDELVLAFPVPAAALRPGPARVTLAADGTPGAEYDHFFVDRVEISYRRTFAAAADGLAFTTDGGGPYDLAVTGLPAADVAVFDVTDPHQAVRLTGTQVPAGPPFTVRFRDAAGGGRSYDVVAGGAYRHPARIEARPRTALDEPAQGADYLAIGPPPFLAAIQPLLDRRASQGLRVAAIDVQSVYDAFGGGQAAPEAIRAFIAHAYAHWPAPPPSYVLLVGDGTYDPRDRLGTGTPTFVPPFLREVDPWLGEVAAENAFVTVAGDDPFPDLFLGRLPVNSAAEAGDVARKTVDYEANPPSGAWRTRLLFAADDPDGAGDFHTLSDAIIQGHAPAGYDLQRVYLGGNYPTADGARAALVKGLNEGYLLTHYLGHGVTAGWSQELILRRADMPTLTNGGRLPVFLDMTCMTGFFDHPSQASIAEAAVRAPAGGAVAAFSPTGFGVATGHDILDSTFLDGLFRTREARLGALAVSAKLALGAATTAYDDLLETFTVLGDPALTIALPDSPTPGGTATATAAPVRPTGGATPAPAATQTPWIVAAPTGTPHPAGERAFLPWARAPRR
jgi:hypothetical protein